MHALLGMLAMVTIVLVVPTDDVYAIEMTAEHYAVAWTVGLQHQEIACRARAWIGRMGERPILTLVAVDFDEEVAPTVERQTPLSGLPSGIYDVHFESDGCWGAFGLVSR